LIIFYAVKVSQARQMKEKKAFGNQHPPQAPRLVNQPHNRLPWNALEQQVVRMQKQISQACQHGDKSAVHTLLERLM